MLTIHEQPKLRHLQQLQSSILTERSTRRRNTKSERFLTRNTESIKLRGKTILRQARRIQLLGSQRRTRTDSPSASGTGRRRQPRSVSRDSRILHSLWTLNSANSITSCSRQTPYKACSHQTAAAIISCLKPACQSWKRPTTGKRGG